VGSLLPLAKIMLCLMFAGYDRIARVRPAVEPACGRSTVRPSHDAESAMRRTGTRSLAG
jgi:hypothetical protein